MPGTTLLVTLGRIWHLLEASCTQCSTSDQQLEQENIGFITPRVDFTTQACNLLTASGLSHYCPSSTQPHPGGLPKHRSDFAASALHKMHLWLPLALKRKSSSLASCLGLSLRYLQPLPFLFLGIMCPHQFWSDLLVLLLPSPHGFWLSHLCTSGFVIPSMWNAFLTLFLPRPSIFYLLKSYIHVKV